MRANGPWKINSLRVGEVTGMSRHERVEDPWPVVKTPWQGTPGTEESTCSQRRGELTTWFPSGPSTDSKDPWVVDFEKDKPPLSFYPPLSWDGWWGHRSQPPLTVCKGELEGPQSHHGHRYRVR